MNKEQTTTVPEDTEDAELKRNKGEVIEEMPDKTPELPARLDFPNKFFQG